MTYTDEQIKVALAESKRHGNALNCQGRPIENAPDSKRRETLTEIIEQLLRERDEAKSTALKAVRERIAGELACFPTSPGCERCKALRKAVTIIDEEMNRA